MRSQWLDGLSSTFIVRVWRRFRQADVFGASSALAFSTLLAIVPLTTVVLTMLTGVPVFQELGTSLENFVYEQLVPSAAGNVQVYMHEFVAKAGELTLWGTVLLFITSLNLLFTLERYFNRIIVFGLSVSLTSYAIVQAQEWTGGEDVGIFLRRVAPIVLVAAGFAALYTGLPNRKVALSAALVGGMVSALLFELAKSMFALWAGRVVGYQAIYGAVAILPLFLMWLWACALVALIGACVTAELNQSKQDSFQD